ncbi:sensor histidine kinase [Hydrogenophaga sp.]|jgi:two-component system sensor histidine kinase PhcS|uniref:sensor histidine kinase n=1 Tax=Hydrogenophaga sp. TaxID=1904254 RepID=UPI0025BA6F8A|nr:ATP-binding protein [Hydrogenophaga sp.]MDO8887353.1 ATP-binding protein [Hydrogenophaga sp.]MDO9504372.1 ATP-binding protein [Hydrogenophaga sp.]MDP2249933.1 ATP-binding protein [Hydrogenophaga sp.]MDP2986521.1 ATP-binding protein [Hydrogenophaga sp.]MDP3628694.1 ATP-binding protein [Hydrogenophaga sp.]
MVSRPSSPYEQQLSDFRLTYSKAGSITSIVLVLAGFGLDYFSYPDRLLEFSLLRVLVAVLTLGVFFVLFTPFGRKHVRSLTMLWLLLPQIMIAFMIFETDGAQSIYFVGLHLALYAVGIILPITFFEGIGFGVLTLGLYVAACVLHGDRSDDSSRLVTNSLFILFSAAASAVCTWFNEKARIRLFSLQHEVSEKNASLREINTQLAEVKGQLIQREKMAAIGTLSAGLLHELNNPVNYSLMAIDMGLTCPGVEGDAMLKESLGDAREGMQRIQNIVSDLKTFAYQKPGQDAQRPFLLGNALRSALRLAGYELKGIDVPVELPQDTHVLGDEPAIIGVLINLLSNAAHALQAAKREQPRIAVTVVPRGQRLFVSVRDNGTGIAPENLGRVFEPFFTTRDVGAGLGLGLSVSYGIVQRHGGTLAVESELGAWTEFTFDLPRPA